MQKIDIIYEDEDILICYKEAGLAVQSSSVTEPDMEHILRSQLIRSGDKSSVIHVIHRLDQPVEGLVIFAKNKKAAADLSRQIQDKGEMSKNYLAVVFGRLPENEKEKELFDYIDRDDNTKSAVITDKAEAKGKAAKLSYKVIGEAEIPVGKIVKFREDLNESSDEEKNSDRQISLLDISLKTGRFHQIRAQLCNMGYPIMGDRRYFTEESNALSRELMVKNVALCAYKINFKHPKTGDVLEYKIEPKGEIFRQFGISN